MIILQHDNARFHSAGLTTEKIEKMRCEISLHPAYSSAMAPSDYHLFGFVKEQMRSKRYKTIVDIQKAVRQWLQTAGTEFYRKEIFKLTKWEKCVRRNGLNIEKRRNMY